MLRVSTVVVQQHWALVKHPEKLDAGLSADMHGGSPD
jgi:hypothetical protein